jgi:hypothetical protein
MCLCVPANNFIFALHVLGVHSSINTIFSSSQDSNQNHSVLSCWIFESRAEVGFLNYHLNLTKLNVKCIGLKFFAQHGMLMCGSIL